MPIPATRTDDATAVTIERRFDLVEGGELRRPYKRESDGALLLEGIPVREGILLYRRADGSIRRELVTRQAVEDTARTLARAPVTLRHPKSGFVTPETAKEDAVGDVDGETYVEEDAQGSFARIKIAVRRKDAIDEVEGGVRQLSPGYKVGLDETPGEHPRFGRYDARQIWREGNHAAIVPHGRGGETVGLRTDSTDAVQVLEHRRADNTRKTTMNPKLVALLAALSVSHLDNEDVGLDEGLAEVKRLTKADAARADEATTIEGLRADNAALQSQLDAAQQGRDELQGKLDAAEARVTALEQAEKAREDAAELERLQGLAQKVDVKADGLGLDALRHAIAKTRVDALDGKSPGYVDGILASIEAETKRADSRGRWDFAPKSGDPPPARADAAEKQFHNPFLAQADEARAGGAQ